MKPIIRTVFILLITILLASLAFIPAGALSLQPADAISLNPTSGTSGITVILAVRGWTDIELPSWLMILWDGSQFVNGIDIDENGNGSRQFSVPDAASPGVHTVLVCDHTMACLKSTFSVSKLPSSNDPNIFNQNGTLTLDPPGETAGTLVTATINGWTSISLPGWATIQWNGNEYVNKITLDEKGNGESYFRIPNVAPGSYPVLICDKTMTCLRSNFEVVASPPEPTVISTIVPTVVAIGMPTIAPAAIAKSTQGRVQPMWGFYGGGLVITAGLVGIIYLKKKRK